MVTFVDSISTQQLPPLYILHKTLIDWYSKLLRNQDFPATDLLYNNILSSGKLLEILGIIYKLEDI